ncbi:MAG: hypothetical protein WCS69_07145 [Ignavibacteriaceae bacterium]|jgi:hypothetical protein
MHLDLQSIVNYITIGIVGFFLAITLVSVLTKKVVAKRRKKEEERLQARAQKQYYSSSKVYTFSVPDHNTAQNPSPKPFEEKPKQVERFKVISELFNENSNSFTYRSRN